MLKKYLIIFLTVIFATFFCFLLVRSCNGKDKTPNSSSSYSPKSFSFSDWDSNPAFGDDSFGELDP